MCSAVAELSVLKLGWLRRKRADLLPQQRPKLVAMRAVLLVLPAIGMATCNVRHALILGSISNEQSFCEAYQEVMWIQIQRATNALFLIWLGPEGPQAMAFLAEKQDSKRDQL